jgi:hypothetical protein
MDSERFATILGFIIALAVLAAAFVYVPLGNKPVAPAAAPAAAPATATPAPAAPRGPVIREVPQ